VLPASRATEYSSSAKASTSSRNRGQFAVVPGGGGGVRNAERVLEDAEVAELFAHGARRDHDEAVEIHPHAALQRRRQSRGAPCAVALADDELGRVPAIVARYVQADEVADRGDVLGEAVELARVHARQCPAVAGRHRVDEHQVGDVEHGVLVVDHRGRRHQARRRMVAVHAAAVAELDAARAHQADVHPHRSRSRAAVEREQQRPLGSIGNAVLGVGDVEDVGERSAVGIRQRQGAGTGGVVDGRAVDHHAALGDRIAGEVLDVDRGRVAVVLLRQRCRRCGQRERDNKGRGEGYRRRGEEGEGRQSGRFSHRFLPVAATRPPA